MSWYDTLSEKELKEYEDELLETITEAEGSEDEYLLEAAHEARGELKELRKVYKKRGRLPY